MTNHNDIENYAFLPHRSERINKFMQRYVNSGKIAGFVSLVAQDGEIIYLDKYGFQNIETKTPMHLDTIFRLFSMTKPITSVALMMLFEQGFIRLEEPVSKYIPEFDDIKVLGKDGKLESIHTPITVKMLLTHTGGLCYGEWDSHEVSKHYEGHNILDPNQSLVEAVKKIVGYPQAYQPGKKWHYSFSTDVVGALVEIISEMTLKDFFSENIFKPLEMHDTGHLVPQENFNRVAGLYGPHENILLAPIDFPNENMSDTKLFFGGHGLYSTAEDYLKFSQMILNKGELSGVRLLASRTVEFMYQNHLHPEQMPMEMGDIPWPGIGFGLGFSRVIEPALANTLSSPGTISWGGAAGTDFWVDFQERLIGILMVQIMPRDQYPTANDFRTAVYQAVIV